MPKVTTRSVNNRSDWYTAIGKVTTPEGHEKRYIAHELTRHAAFMAVARQLATAGYYRF